MAEGAADPLNRNENERLRGDLWVEAMKSAPMSAGTVPVETDSDVRRLA